VVLLTRDIVVFVLLVELENNAKKVWTEFELKLPSSGSEWLLNNYWKCSENFPTFSKGSSHIERFHSRDQHLCKFIGTKESLCIRKEFNSHRIGLGHQHDRRFIVLGHQYGCRDVMWKHYSNVPCQMWTRWSNFSLSIFRALWSRFASPCKMRARAPFWNVWNARQQGTQGNHRGPKKVKNRPFPSSKKSHSQNEAKCETFVVKMSFICIIIKNHFHINGFALSLALKVRFFGTRKWSINNKPWETDCFSHFQNGDRRHLTEAKIPCYPQTHIRQQKNFLSS